MAGGKGERLRPLTADRPKPMVPVGDKPILQRHLEWPTGNGVSDVALLCGYKHEAIEAGRPFLIRWSRHRTRANRLRRLLWRA